MNNYVDLFCLFFYFSVVYKVIRIFKKSQNLGISDIKSRDFLN